MDEPKIDKCEMFVAREQYCETGEMCCERYALVLFQALGGT